MEALREYILSVSATAILCGILCSICGEKSFSAGTVKLICGLVLTICAIRPLIHIRLENVMDTMEFMGMEGNLAAQEGVDYANQALGQLIKEKTRSYILDKAAELEVNAEVEVAVSDDAIPVPCQVTITGHISPYARAQLKSFIESQLGIPRECQQWING